MQQIPIHYERHIFVCVNERMAPRDSCGGKNSRDILMALRDHINRNGLLGKYNVSMSKCLGHCLEGPTIAVYPEGKIFKKVSMDDVHNIIKEYLS